MSVISERIEAAAGKTDLTPSVRWALASLSLAMFVAVHARHQYRQCWLADDGAGIQRLLPKRPMDCHRIMVTKSRHRRGSIERADRRERQSCR
jgi:hypothetical protein